MKYQCPLCKQPLLKTDKSWQCSTGHVYDRAKEGYVNLLPVQHKNSTLPGDSLAMIQARRTFLNKDYYAPLRQAILHLLAQYLPENPQALLDLGCGEGYYTTALHTAFSSVPIYGLDIAKGAVKYASKRVPQAHFCVASSYQLPFTAAAFDAVLCVYAPFQYNELIRVTNANGVFVLVTPAPRHLYQLKALIYQDVHLHEQRQAEFVDFIQIAEQRLAYEMFLPGEQAVNLLQMTPFAWKTTELIKRYLLGQSTFNCETDFCLRVFKRK